MSTAPIETSIRHAYHGASPPDLAEGFVDRAAAKWRADRRKRSRVRRVAVFAAASIVLAATVSLLEPRLLGPVLWRTEDGTDVTWESALMAAIRPHDAVQARELAPLIARYLDQRGAAADSTRGAIVAQLDSAQRASFESEWTRLQAGAGHTLPLPPVVPPGPRSR